MLYIKMVTGNSVLVKKFLQGGSVEQVFKEMEGFPLGRLPIKRHVIQRILYAKNWHYHKVLHLISKQIISI